MRAQWCAARRQTEALPRIVHDLASLLPQGELAATVLQQCAYAWQNMPFLLAAGAASGLATGILGIGGGLVMLTVSRGETSGESACA